MSKMFNKPVERCGVVVRTFNHNGQCQKLAQLYRRYCRILTYARHGCLYWQVEAGTAFGRWYTAGESPLPQDDTCAAMYRAASRVLGGAGYEHYEVRSITVQSLKAQRAVSMPDLQYYVDCACCVSRIVLYLFFVFLCFPRHQGQKA